MRASSSRSGSSPARPATSSCARISRPARSPEFLAHAKANPGKVTNGHAGVGSTPHLACLFLAHLTGMKPRLDALSRLGAGDERPRRRADRFDVRPRPDGRAADPGRHHPRPDARPARALAGDAGRADLEARPASTAYLFTGWNAVFAPKGTPKEVVDEALGRAPGGACRRRRAAPDRGARLAAAEARRAHARAPAPGRARRPRQVGRGRSAPPASRRNRGGGNARFSALPLVIPGPREARSPEPTAPRQELERC